MHKRARALVTLLSIVSILVLTIVLLSSVKVRAAGLSSNITTSPISLDVNDQPGQSSTSMLQMENNGPQPVTVDVVLQTFKADGTNGRAQLTNLSPNDPTLSWVHFSQTSFVAEPGVWKSIQMTISLPKSADLGYYYAVLFKPVLSIGQTTVNTNTVTLSNAILVLVDTESSNEVRQLQVTSFTANHKIYEYLPVQFSINVRNTGNIYLPPQGVVYMSKNANFNTILATIVINKDQGRVLPNSSRIFNLTWSDGFPNFQPETIAGQPVLKKNGQPIDQLHWNFANANHFRFGKYYARMALVYNNGQRDVPIVGVVSFWVIPWKLILLILGVLAIQIALIVTVLRYRHMYRKTSKGHKLKSKGGTAKEES